ncbi:UNVERIFIED_CONTAM: putative MFS family arabinose efflux permease [Acetivibrio alkalicellulosi]
MNIFHFKLFKGLPKSIYVLLVVQTIIGFGNFVVPYLSLYLNTNWDLNKDFIGLFVSIPTFCFIPGVIIGGKLSDHYSKKIVLVVSRLLSSFCLICVLFSGNFLFKLILISMFTLFSAVATPSNDSLIADLTSREQRKQAYSLIYLGYNIGGTIGPLVAGYAFLNYPDIIFIGEAFSILISGFLILLKVKEPKRQTNELKIENNKTSLSGNSLSILFKQPALVVYMILSAFYTFSYAQNYFCLPLFMDFVFPNNSSYYFGILMMVNGICIICFTAVLVKLTVKFSTAFNMFITGLFYSVGFGMFFFISSLYMIIVATVFWTLGEILFNTNFTVYIVEKSPYNYRARMISISSIITRSAISINPVLMGNIMQNGGVRIVWLIVFVVMTIASIGMFYLYQLEKRPKVNSFIHSID